MALQKAILPISWITETKLVFGLCLAVMAGPALTTLFDYQLQHFPDAQSYLALAQGEFDQTTVRRYRVLIPLAAAALNLLSGDFTEVLRPSYFHGNFPLAFSFFLVNMLVMAIFGMLVYRLCRSFHCSALSALVGLLSLLTARYTYYFAALPLVDSLVCLATVMVLLGIREQNQRMLTAAIFIGPWARESFVFVAPLILLFAAMPLRRQILYFALSGSLVFAFRYAFDWLHPPSTTPWLYADLQHLHNVKLYAPLLFSFYGIYKIVINAGLWLLLPLLVFLLHGNYLRGTFGNFAPCAILFLASVLVQLLLSGSMERLAYPAMIIFAVVVALGARTLLAETSLEKSLRDMSG